MPENLRTQASGPSLTVSLTPPRRQASFGQRVPSSDILTVQGALALLESGSPRSQVSRDRARAGSFIRYWPDSS